ncbi:MAG: 2-oxo acid dehydrogenase subunit E2 [Novosphingobium sp.]|nr:2-oxo acid dehydrogenase subunit E2 [Novosphingobium sp.]
MSDIRPFCMPKWGIEMTEGTIAEWMVSEGQAFTRGQTLCLIETAKITNEVEAEYDAVVRKVLVGAGAEAQPVGTLLAVFADANASEAEIDAFVAGFRPADTAVAAKKAEPAKPSVPVAVPKKIVTNRPISAQALKLAEAEGLDIAEVEGSGRHGRITHQDVQQALRPAARAILRGPAKIATELETIFASPLARRIAALHGVDLAPISGTGPRGRISKADVLALIPAPTAGGTQPFVAGENRPEILAFDRIRKVVARRLTEAKQTIPHFYLRTSASADALIGLRKTANMVLGCKASLNDYLIKATALGLVRHSAVNVQVHGEELHRFPHADIAVAVASPKGLVTPVVRSAELMRIDQVAAETRRLIDKAQAGRLGFEDMEGGTFSVSNLGMFGVESFDAIINPPQGAILAVGAANRVAVERGDGSVGFETRIALTLSVDHRAIDGATGAEFLATLKNLIEEPEQLFV